MTSAVRKSGRKLVMIGDGEFAEIACEYFTADSPYEVAAFAVERAFLKKDSLFGRPVVAFEDVENLYAPGDHDVFTAITYTRLNRVRGRLYRAARAKGYTMATYVSSHAFVWPNAVIGENSFIFENNVVQYRATIGNDVVLWSGNHIGHRAVIGDDCFISSHVVISGYCHIDESCFIGVNATIGDRVRIGRDCIIGAGAVVLRDAEGGKVYRGNPAVAAEVGSLRISGVRE